MEEKDEKLEKLEKLADAFEFIDKAKEALTEDQQIALAEALISGLTPQNELEEDSTIEPGC